MKPTKYRIYLSDGTKADIESQNAGEAIEEALRKYRGRKVITCLSGQSSTNGKIEYDIPNHNAIDEGAILSKPRGKKIDSTEAMFADAETKGIGRLSD